MSFMISCKENSRLVTRALDKPLSLREKFLTRIHMVLCKVCRLYAQQIGWVDQFFKKRFHTDTLGDNAKEKMIKSLEKEMSP